MPSRFNDSETYQRCEGGVDEDGEEDVGCCESEAFGWCRIHEDNASERGGWSKRKDRISYLEVGKKSIAARTDGSQVRDAREN